MSAKLDLAKYGLPITDALPALLEALSTSGKAVLVAPPGAGKTTLVPLALLDARWRGDGMIVLMEPRRLAARAAARRMASMLGEQVGETVGYRMRLDNKVSAKTRILVVTEGVFARMALDDPELKGITAVLFDEFHERSLDADFGLALTLDIRDGLRPDLRLIVMSATLDGARVAAMLDDAVVVRSHGRAFRVDIRYEDKRTGERIDAAVARTIRSTLASEQGSILAFLPGTSEINATARQLEGRLAENVRLCLLHGSMEQSAQDEAIRPAPDGIRKVVLATSIAETSITIDGIRVVIDSGLQRLPVFEPSSGLTRLETVRASKAAIAQRAGRAGRTAPGIAIRLWHQGQTAVLPDFTPPEILEADLASLTLDLAAFGVTDPATMRFLDAPPPVALKEARDLLTRLGALDTTGRVTKDGEAMRRLALPVRLSHMVVKSASRGQALNAAELSVLLTERGLGGNDADLDRRLINFRRDRSERADAARGLARRLAQDAGGKSSNVEASAGRLLLDAFPDRVAKSRGRDGRFLLVNGRGGEMELTNALATKDWLVVADMLGSPTKSRILSAAEVSLADIEEAMPEALSAREETAFDAEKRAIRSRRVRRLGSIILDDNQMAAPQGDAANRGIIDAVRVHGLHILDWNDASTTLRKRMEWLRKGLGEQWPDVSDACLIRSLDDWLLPFLTGKAQVCAIAPDALANGLRSLIPHELSRQLNMLAPTHFEAPTGNHHPIRYEGDEPVLAIRVQELFGLKTHPSIAKGKVPLLLELNSPAHRPIQLTRDLPGFWVGSWADVRADMRGRYPKHFWPEDPANAAPTARAKPRGT